MMKPDKVHKPVKNPMFYNLKFLEKRLSRIELEEEKIDDRKDRLTKRVEELSGMRTIMMTPFLKSALRHSREQLQADREKLLAMGKEKKAMKRAIKNKKKKEHLKGVIGGQML